jgi:hypothetical protein
MIREIRKPGRGIVKSVGGIGMPEIADWLKTFGMSEYA